MNLPSHKSKVSDERSQMPGFVQDWESAARDSPKEIEIVFKTPQEQEEEENERKTKEAFKTLARILKEAKEQKHKELNEQIENIENDYN